MGIYIDGGGAANFASGFLKERRVSFPFDWPNNGMVKETTLVIQQYTNVASTLSLQFGSVSGSVPGAVLTGKGPVVPIGGGISEYSLTYTETPAAWNETGVVAYTYPGLSGGIAENWSPYYYRASVSLYAVANIAHEFSQGAAPVPEFPFLVTDAGNVVDYIGTSNPNFFPAVLTNPSAEPINYVVTGSVAVVRPTIWEKVTVRVGKPV